jgi:hypothetical protein
LDFATFAVEIVRENSQRRRSGSNFEFERSAVDDQADLVISQKLLFLNEATATCPAYEFPKKNPSNSLTVTRKLLLMMAGSS